MFLRRIHSLQIGNASGHRVAMQVAVAQRPQYQYLHTQYAPFSLRYSVSDVTVPVSVLTAFSVTSNPPMYQPNISLVWE